MSRSIAPTFNPFLALIRDSAWMLNDGFALTQEKGRKRTYEGEFRSATLHSIVALRCFANNCIHQKGEEPLLTPLAERLSAVAALWGVEPLSEEESRLLRELEEIESIIQNPSISSSYDANSPGGNMIDFDRTQIFGVPKQCESWSAEYAAICLGVTLRFTNDFVLNRLVLSADEITQVFGYSIRSEDGFQDVIDPFRYRGAVKALGELRDSVVVKMLITHRGFGPEDYQLRFLPDEKPA